MSDFELENEELYNNDMATQGVWLPGCDQTGKVRGQFKLRCIDPYSQRHELAVKRISQKYAREQRLQPWDDWRSLVVTLVETAILDWKDINDGKGKPVPYSIEAALKFFSIERARAIVVDLTRKAQDFDNFKSDGETSPADIEKN